MAKEKTKHRVFISSTYLDNVERRRGVENAVLRADVQPVGMERFTTSENPAMEECVRSVYRTRALPGYLYNNIGFRLAQDV